MDEDKVPYTFRSALIWISTGSFESTASTAGLWCSVDSPRNRLLFLPYTVMEP
jgi:hypothetical protein